MPRLRLRKMRLMAVGRFAVGGRKAEVSWRVQSLWGVMGRCCRCGGRDRWRCKDVTEHDASVARRRPSNTPLRAVSR